LRRRWPSVIIKQCSSAHLAPHEENRLMKGLGSKMGIGLVLLACSLATARGAQTPPRDKNAERIVFSSDRSGAWRIWSVRPDGTDPRELSKAGADEHDVDPVFSPDAKTILFTSTRGGTAGVWKMSADGTKPARICDGDQAEWSPDGAQIVLRRKEQLFTRELATGGENRISPGDWPHCSGPAWSPDGKQIAFACRWEAGNAIFLVPVAGGKPVTVYDKKGACEPHWSPDGKRLVYETETQLCTIDPDGKKNRPLTFFGGVQRYGRFSPDGKAIVYCQGASERGPWELYTIPAQGGAPVKLTEGASDMTPDWK
jgi:Tol biopolymer transport system component